MNAILAQWLGARPAKLTSNTAATRQAMRRRFSDDSFCEWRLAVLVRIGAPTMALRTLNNCHLSSSTRRLQQAHTEVAAGLYRRAAARFVRASIEALRQKDGCSACDVLLDACDAYRIGGATVRSGLTLAVSSCLVCDSNRAKLLLKLVLLIYSLQGFVSMVRLNFFSRWLRKRVASVLKKCANEALAKGNWLDFQQAGLIGKRMGIALSDLAEGDFYPPPDPGEGYQQLGYFLAQSMSVLDEITIRSPETISAFECSEIKRMVETQLHFCDVLGIVPQSWKLRAASRDYIALIKTAETEFVKIMIENFNACEYGFLMRWYWRRRFPFLNTALRSHK